MCGLPNASLHMRLSSHPASVTTAQLSIKHTDDRADPSSAILKDRVIRLLGRCTEWRERNDRQAVELAQAATEPADVIVYWILKRLEGPSGLPVTVPCKRVELDTSALQASCSRVRFAVVAAALQAVHSRNFAPHSKVRSSS